MFRTTFWGIFLPTFKRIALYDVDGDEVPEGDAEELEAAMLCELAPSVLSAGAAERLRRCDVPTVVDERDVVDVVKVGLVQDMVEAIVGSSPGVLVSTSS